MTTPYVYLQKAIIDLLKQWLAREHALLCRFAERYCIESPDKLVELEPEDLIILLQCGDPADFGGDNAFAQYLLEIITQQINVDNGIENISIRDVLGTPFSHLCPVDWKGYDAHKGNGENMLRTTLCANPRALQVGDVLASGEMILSPPREGGNGTVWVQIDNGNGHGLWRDYSSRTVLALIGCRPDIVTV